MKYQVLEDFFKNKISSKSFFLFYKEEIENYISLSTNKNTIPVYSDIEIESFTEMDLIGVLKLYLKEEIYEWDLEYILSFLEMSYTGDNERIEKTIFYLADPYLNYHIDKFNVEQAIRYLEKETLDLYLKGVNIRLKQKGKNFRPDYKSKILALNSN